MLNTDADGPNNSYSMPIVCIANKALFFLAVGMSRAECMPESKVLNANELETLCDTAIKLFINSVTEQLATATLIGVQLIDFFNRGTSVDGPVIDGDSNRDQSSLPSKLLHH